jgi:hypothetical protein
MGFGFRKTFNSGPFRFTVSPGGVSSSFGVRGARITSGPRGTFVTVSSHGAYYRHRIDGNEARVPGQDIPTQQVEEGPVDSVFQVPVSELVASNQSELVTKLNENISATNPGNILFVVSWFLIFAVPSYPTTAFFLMALGMVSAFIVSKKFKATHTHQIHYSLDSEATERFAATQNALAMLASCHRIWVLNTSSSTADFKRNAGAHTLITRRSASVGTLATRGFTSSLPISSIEANGTVFHFLPDQILVLYDKRYASISYGQLSVSVTSSRFIETESVPGDSRQVDTTWRFVNKNGGPDRRFNDNRQIPILQYGELALRTTAGLQVVLQTSSFEKAQVFVSQFAGSTDPKAPGATSTETPRRNSNFNDSSLLQCYALLGLTRPTTLDRAAAAHREQASLYHPDKYEHLAPDIKVLAAKKMAEINVAYERVKADLEGKE